MCTCVLCHVKIRLSSITGESPSLQGMRDLLAASGTYKLVHRSDRLQNVCQKDVKTGNCIMMHGELDLPWRALESGTRLE